MEIKDEANAKSFLSMMQGQLGNPFVLKNDDIVVNTEATFFGSGGSEKMPLRRNSSA